MFSNNTMEVDRREATKVLCISRSMENDSYLGLPLLFGRSKVKELWYIKERLWQRVQSWGGRLLSQAEREVMI